jgi:hypothetical protein
MFCSCQLLLVLLLELLLAAVTASTNGKLLALSYTYLYHSIQLHSRCSVLVLQLPAATSPCMQCCSLPLSRSALTDAVSLARVLSN